MNRNKLLALLLPASAVIALDQYTKWLVRTTPELHRMDIIEGWLSFYYTQNSGMAMGIDVLSTPVISSISILATIGIITYLLYTIQKSSVGYLAMMGLVIGGALGNITDRMIMGYIEGYGGLLEGHVVDFIHFNLEINGWPVFPYIFNVADIAISVSIITLLVFNKKFFPPEEEEYTFKLSSSQGKEILEPTLEQIHAALEKIEDSNGSFIILNSPNGYVQATGTLPDKLMVEYQADGVQYQTVNQPVTIDDVKEIFRQFYSGEEAYITKFEWKEIGKY